MSLHSLAVLAAGLVATAVTVGATKDASPSETPEFPGARRDADRRFLNPRGPIPFAGPLVTWPFFLRRAATMLMGRDGAPEVVANDGSFLRENAGHSVPSVTWIGHATLLVQMDHVTFLTDPIWSDRASPVGFAGPKRFVPPGLALEALPPIDLVLISHNHYDHLDAHTLRMLARRDPRTRFLVPLENGHILRDEGVANVTELDWGQQLEHGSVKIIFLPTQHWSRRGPFDARKSLWGSYAVIGPARRFYFAGDSGYFDGFATAGAKLGPFDLAALPIGAYAPAAMMHAWHMNPEEAIQAGRDLRASQLVGMHYGTFDLSDEPLDEPPRRLRDAATAAGIGADSVLTLRVGETRVF